jgi:hypothetical protein
MSYRQWFSAIVLPGLLAFGACGGSTSEVECSGACVKGSCYSARGSCDYTPT